MRFSADAVAGFVGVVTGSAITGGIQLALAARAERRSIRTARRLVRAELRRIRVALEHGIETGDWELVTGPLHQTSQWERFADHLAGGLSDAAWHSVERGYRARYAVVGSLDLPEGHPERTPPVFPEALELVDAAIASLASRWNRRMERKMAATQDEQTRR